MGRKMRRGHGASGWLWLMGGVAAGTAIGWLTAPRRGDWVRNQTRQKLDHWYRTGVRRMRKRGRDIENRVQGGVAEIREVWSGREHYVDANTLTDQVHSAIGREFAAILPHINLNAVDHTVYLHGYVHEAEQRERLICAIAAVDGVEDVQAAELRVQAPQETPAGRTRRRSPSASS
ncbi:MAG: BON domain-containing protein [Terriglobales bacterium]